MTTTNEDAGPSDEQIETAIDAWFTYDEAHAHDFKWRMRNALLEAQALAPSKVQVEAVRATWQPIETAPKDGSVIDLWVGGEFAGRRASCYWGMPEHNCGEHGRYCDSDWHDLDDGWVDDMNESLPSWEQPTHWMPLPEAPDAAAASGGEKV